MKKAYLGLAALAVLGTGSLASCNKQPGFIIWAPSEEKAVIEQVLGDYNKANPDDQIEWGFRAIEEGVASGELEKDPQQANYPSLYAVVDSSLPDMVHTTKVVASLPDDVAKKVTAENSESAVLTTTIDGKMYAYPISVDNGYFLYYDKRELKENEIGSFESILNICETKGKQFLLDLDNGYYSAGIFLSPEVLGTSDGISYHTEADGTVVYDMKWDGEIGAAAARDFSALVAPYAAKDRSIFIEGDNTAIANQAKAGKLISCISGTWVYEELKADWGEENVGTAKLPTFNVTFKGDSEPTACQMASFVGSKVYCVNAFAKAEEQALAHKVAQILTTKEAQLVRYEKRSSTPSNKEAALDPRFTEHITPAVAGLQAQEPYGAAQTLVEGLYWTPGEAIGRTIMQGGVSDTQKYTTLEQWQAYLKTATETLTDPSKRV